MDLKELQQLGKEIGFFKIEEMVPGEDQTASGGAPDVQHR